MKANQGWLARLRAYKKKGKKIAMLTAYDYPFAKILDEVGIDVILVGDSLGNVVLGYENTLPVTMEEMLHHLKAVRRGVRHAFLVADFPLLGFRDAFNNAKKLVAAGADAIKIEGIRHSALLKKCVQAGIPVMGHIGFTPQSVGSFAKVSVQGKSPEEMRRLIKEARFLEAAGAFALVIELTDPQAARKITRAIKIPTIGCGSGPATDGQVLVLYDILGLTQGKVPSFARQLVNFAALTKNAVKQYIRTAKNSF
jgi:3-methyl-2-oxobutanoate hydroxymethyltransferase